MCFTMAAPSRAGDTRLLQLLENLQEIVLDLQEVGAGVQMHAYKASTYTTKDYKFHANMALQALSEKGNWLETFFTLKGLIT